MPASPAKVSGFAPAATPRRVDLRKAPRDDGGLAVVAQAERVRGTGGDGHDVLERAGQLHAHEVPVAVQPERPTAEQLHDPGADRVVQGSRPPRSRAARPRSRPRGWGPTARRPGRGSMGSSAAQHLAHPEQAAALDALGDRDDDGVRPEHRRDAHRRRHACGAAGTAITTSSRAAATRPSSAVTRTASGSGTPGRCAMFSRATRDRAAASTRAGQQRHGTRARRA